MWMSRDPRRYYRIWPADKNHRQAAALSDSLRSAGWSWLLKKNGCDLF